LASILCKHTFETNSEDSMGGVEPPNLSLGRHICARLTLVRLSSFGRAPTSATEPSVQLDFESWTISADGPQTAGLVILSNSRGRRFRLVSGTKAQCDSAP